jgi:predicted molibdopterin-dependent oxidoreductase YjgC
VFGAGGGTSSYREVEETNLVILWGSNARETHPIFFHHLLRGIHNGATLIAVDPRRTSSSEWADVWMGIDVGADIALANAMARVIIHEGLANREFIDRATSGFEEFARCVEAYTLDRAHELTGVPGTVIQDAAIAYARAERAMICWTLGITEHHNATDNVLALINLALLTGKVGRYGCGLNPLRGQNNVQGGGDMGGIPARLPGFQDIEEPEIHEKFTRAWASQFPRRKGWHLSEMFEAIERGDLRALYVIGENPARSEADQGRTVRLLRGLDHLVVQDIFMTQTAELAHVVLPATAGWAESEGTVTNSERRVQRVRRALEPPPGARDDIDILSELARRLGCDWGNPTAEQAWDECRRLSPMHAGMSYRRLDELGGIQWPCPDESHAGTQFLHGRLWKDPVEGPRAPFHAVEFEPPVDALSEEFPIRLTTGRRLDSFNTGVQSNEFTSPLRTAEAIVISPEDGARLGLADGETVRVSSRRGTVDAPVRFDRAMRPGLAFLTLHFPDQVATNVLTIDATDPKSGTAEFKASAIRIDKVGSREPAPA